MTGISKAVRRNPFKKPWALSAFDAPEAPEAPPAPDPSPEPMELAEMGRAKTKARGRRPKGRFSTILAGRLTSQRGKTLLGE